MTISNQGPDAKELQKFGLLLGSLIALFFGLLIPWLWSLSWSLWPWLLAGMFIAWSGLAPASLAPVYRLWMRIGNTLGWINNRLILSVLFYLFVTPIGLIMRTVRRDPMARKFDRQSSSYRLPAKSAGYKRLDRPF